MTPEEIQKYRRRGRDLKTLRLAWKELGDKATWPTYCLEMLTPIEPPVGFGELKL